jgi:hypothetical protein
MNILAIDVGFGSTKVTYLDPANRLINRSYITGLAKKVDSGIFKDENSVELDGVTYLCFDRALLVPGNQQIQITDFDSLCLATPIFIRKIEADLNMKFDAVVAGLSIAMVDQTDAYHQRIVTALGLPEDRVKVLQQGVGGWYTYKMYGLDPYNPISQDVKMQNYLLIDIGHNTMDVISVLGGNLSEDTVAGITGAGTTWIAQKLMQYILKNYKVDITQANARELVQKRLWNYRGVTVDLNPVINQIGIEYATYSVNTLESKFSDSMMNRQGLLFIGGSSLILNQFINEIPEVKQLFHNHFGDYFINIPNVPEYYNSIGYHLLGSKIFK